MTGELLPLPITPQQALQHILPQAFALLPQRMASDPARVMLLVIALQESNLADRRQGTAARPGPARGLAQFERNGVIGVMNHVASRDIARRVARARRVVFDADAIHQAMEHDDVLAFAFTRLLLWTDSRRLPTPGQAQYALDYYLWNWRPGAAKTAEGLAEITERWHQHSYPAALAAVGA